MIRCLIFFLALLLACIHAQGQPPVTLDVRHMPAPVLIDGKPVIYYELWLASAAASPFTLQSLEVINAGDSSLIAAFTADDLKRRYSMPAGPAKEMDLPPGAVRLLYLEIVLPAAKRRQQLSHRLRVIDASHKTSTLVGGLIKLSLSSASPVLGQPLHGGPWVAIYEPAWERGHRRVIYAVSDTARISGRFAIDFILVDKEAKMTHHNPDSIVNWYGYAADVLAVADGVVAAARNDFPESPTLSAHPKHPPERAAGNYVALDIGDGRYVFYEHLKPGSIGVKAGQRVKKGERLAALGFTGQTTGPHLHLHVADRNSTLGAEGLPFALEKFTLLGFYPNAEGLGEKPWVTVPARQNVTTQQRPAPNAVIQFPE